MMSYAFGAMGYKLGDRVEDRLSGRRGMITHEIVHVSGCNTFAVLTPKTLKDGRMPSMRVDSLRFRKLEPSESVLDYEKVLDADNSFMPKGADVAPEWIKDALMSSKEYVTEPDEYVGESDAEVPQIKHMPGLEVYSKLHGLPMTVLYVFRRIYCRELTYGCVYYLNDKEVVEELPEYALLPLETKIELPLAGGKTGAVMTDDAELEIGGGMFV